MVEDARNAAITFRNAFTACECVRYCVASGSDDRPAKQVGEQRRLNQHSLNRGSARIHGSVCSVRQSGMPKEPRLNSTAYWRVHRRFSHGPAGRSSPFRTLQQQFHVCAQTPGKAVLTAEGVLPMPLRKAIGIIVRNTAHGGSHV